MIIAAVGMAGSGKSVFCDAMAARGMPVVYFGGLVLEEVANRGLPPGAESERAVREDLRARHGMAAMAHLALPRLSQLRAENEHVGIDGLYSYSEYRALKQAFGADLALVAIVAPRALRYQRLSQRPKRALSPAEAIARDHAEIENLEKGGPIALADVYIPNDGNMAVFSRDIDRILGTVLSHGGFDEAAAREDTQQPWPAPR